MSAAPICLALGLGQWGCAGRTGPDVARPAPAPAARRAPRGIAGVIVALRPVPGRTLGAVPLGDAAAPAEPPRHYVEVVIRDRDGQAPTPCCR